MIRAFLVLLALAGGFLAWGVVVSNGDGPADQRLGGAYLTGIGVLFAIAAAFAGLAALVMAALN